MRRALITVVYRPFCICFSEHKFTAARLVHLQFNHWTTLLRSCHLHLSPILLQGSQLRQPVHPKYHVVTRDMKDSEISFEFLTHDHSRSLHTVSLSIFCPFATLISMGLASPAPPGLRLPKKSMRQVWDHKRRSCREPIRCIQCGSLFPFLWEIHL